jgi:hypothetical protein
LLKENGCTLYKIYYIVLVIALITKQSPAQDANAEWIRPQSITDAPFWGIKNGITVSLWPAAAESARSDGGPRGLLRIGYNYMGTNFLINFIAIEPVVDDDMEFSEVSPSAVDGKWGKFIWAADSITNNHYTGNANTRGTITHPDALHPGVEELSFYLFMEQFKNDAHPYIKISIRSDAPGELCMQVFNEENSAGMQRCALTATMGNYSRLRLLYLKNNVVDAGKLFAGYNDIDFIEKQPYSYNELLRTRDGDYIALIESNEDFAQLADWPQQPPYFLRNGWRYRPFYKLTQYWRKPLQNADSSLTVRVNGRVKYWGGESNNAADYIDIPGGAAFENFELRDNYHAGEKFVFGLSLLSAKQLIDSL